MKCRVSLLILMLLIFIQPSFSQCKTYQLDAKHDTINCTDFNNLKQGKWVTRVVNNHGEPGYQDEGVYVDDKKEGAWTTYNLMGDVIAEENYKWGNKNGACRYYNLMGLIREESWKAIDPLNPYDTVRVYHLDNPDKYDLRIMKVASSTVKHGTWTYYDAERGTITKTEEYVIDQLITNKKSNQALNDSLTNAQKKPADSLSIANKNKPPEVLQYEKKNSNKKKIKVRDGATGVN
jgi:antitoxin component YwqK of YwqJK toxin-antitoxin module